MMIGNYDNSSEISSFMNRYIPNKKDIYKLFL